MKRYRKTLAAILSLVMVLIWTPPIWAYEDWDQTPVHVDALVVRPFGVAATVVGAVLFLVTLPFSVITGSTEEAANQMVVAPYRFTFERPLGFPTTPYADSGW